jgi:hypothetical protein
MMAARKRARTTAENAAAAAATGKRPARRTAARADYGAPIDGFLARQPPHLRAILEALRGLICEVAPDAEASLKWGMPWFTVWDRMVCALGGHRSHVNLILMGPPQAFRDPEGRLLGEGKGGRRLMLTSLDDLPRASARQWLRTAARLARQKGLSRAAPAT